MKNRPFSDISFTAYLADEQLVSTRCRACGELFTPQRSLCVSCYSTDMEWLELQGTGRLLAFTCIHIGAKFMAEQDFDRNHPYCVGVVGLDEGTKVNARIIGVDANVPESIRIGTRLKVTYLHVGEDEARTSYLAFAPVE